MALVDAKTVAGACDTDAKTFRRFMRSHVRGIGGTVGQDTPGRGGRYAFDEDDVPAIVDAFHDWQRVRGGYMLVRFESPTGAPDADELDADADADTDA